MNKAPFFYQVRLRIDVDRADAWEQWMVDVHLPDVLATGCFERAWICREPAEDSANRRAYQMIYIAPSRADFERYQADYAEALQADHSSRYAGSFDASRQLCDALHEFTMT